MIENLAYAILRDPMFRLASDQLFKLSFCLSLFLSFRFSPLPNNVPVEWGFSHLAEDVLAGSIVGRSSSSSSEGE